MGYEPLVSGGNLLGVWVLPEEYRKIGFFWEMNSGKCFRLERRAFQAGAFTFLRQATEVAGKVSFIFYVKVSNDPESAPIPVQSRDYTALAGRNNVCTNLGKPYPCTAKDLDYTKEKGYLVGQEEGSDGGPGKTRWAGFQGLVMHATHPLIFRWFAYLA